MSKTRLLMLGALVALAMPHPARAAEDAVGARVKATTAIQTARESLDTVIKARLDAGFDPADRTDRKALSRQQQLDQAARDLEQASTLLESGDAARAQHFAERAAHRVWHAWAPQRTPHGKGGR